MPIAAKRATNIQVRIFITHTHMSPDDLGGVFKGMSIVLECVVVRREDVGRGFGAVMEGVRRSGKEQVPRSVDGGRRFRVV